MWSEQYAEVCEDDNFKRLTSLHKPAAVQFNTIRKQNTTHRHRPSSLAPLCRALLWSYHKARIRHKNHTDSSAFHRSPTTRFARSQNEQQGADGCEGIINRTLRTTATAETALSTRSGTPGSLDKTHIIFTKRTVPGGIIAACSSHV